MATEVNTGKKLKLIETDDINKVPFEEGQYIIVDDGMVYYDPTIGSSITDRMCLTPKQEVDVYVRSNNLTDEYYLSLQTKPHNGDLVVIKDLIEGTRNYIYSIYLYNDNEEDTNSSEWVKLTGSYSADNVYFDKDIVITTEIPGIELENGRKVINAVGKNVTEIFDAIFAPEKNPTITQPSIEISFPEAGAYELGTIITPTYDLNLNPGSYQFGPETEVIANSYKAVSSSNVTKSGKSGSFSQLTVNVGTNFYITATISHSSGTIPKTAKGDEFISGQIKAGTIQKVSPAITGYVEGLYFGTDSTKALTSNNVTSAYIRNLNKTRKGYENTDVDMIVPVGTKSIILACPEDSAGISKVFNHTANCDMAEAFGTPFRIKVNGNSTSSSYAKYYNVWIYTPAEPYEIAAKLTISRI